ncbi:hypothetical protein [Salicibibacter kimchii]|uniref:Uncharacterized protein n=1 Tax=Salicibibacter kimchii TaxID=2099786 RepID=A0A345BWJ4_9BACI|nr:hypothetical protein [Salicibibacter kimchii]AXF55325.1 hypothetical protein DT065_04335 [Salicibibacter kimchii]
MNVTDEELEQLIRNLDDQNKTVAKSFLMWLLESQMIDDDDMLTPIDIKAIEKARKEQENGETSALEDVKHELDV